MAGTTPDRGQERPGMEFSSSFLSLHARWAEEMGDTIYAALPTEGHSQANYQVYHGEHGIIVATQLSGLEDTRREGSFVSRVDVTAQFAPNKRLTGVVVQFYRPYRGQPQQFFETACAADDLPGFLAAMSQLPRSRQRDINLGLQSIGARMGLPADALSPSVDLQNEMLAQRARRIMANVEEQLREPDLGAA